MKKQALSYLAGRVFPAGLAFFSTLAYLPLVGPEEYGRFAVPFAIAGMLNLSIFQWIRVSYTRQYVHPSKSRETLTAILLGLTLFGIIAVALLAALIGTLAADMAGIALAVAAMLASLALSDANLEVFRAKRAAGIYATIFSIRQCIVSATSLWLAFRGYGHVGLIVGMCAGNLTTALLSLAKQFVPLLLAEHSHWRTQVRQMVAYGWPLSINYSLSAIMNSSDRLIVNAILGPTAVGIYSFASDIAKQTVMTVMEAINLAAFPQATAVLEKSGKEAAQRQLATNFELINAVTVPVVVGISLVSIPIAKISLGDTDAALVARLMLIVSIATYLRGMRVYYFDQAFQLSNKTIGALKGGAFSSIALLITCPILVSTVGVMGAALSSVVAFGSALFFSRMLGHASFYMPTPVAAIIRPVTAAIIMATAVMTIPKPVENYILIIQTVVVGACVYVCTMIILNSFSIRSRIIELFSRHRRG